MKKLVLVLSVWALALCAACGDDNGGNPSDGGVSCPEPNFVSIHDNLLSQNTCARSGCHNGAQAQGGLDLAGGADAVFAELTVEPTVNTSAAQAMRVSGGSANDSFLYIKVSTPGPGVMPPAGMTAQCEQDAIRDWINAGGAR